MRWINNELLPRRVMTANTSSALDAKRNLQKKYPLIILTIFFPRKYRYEYYGK